jgi:hypothetical protein
MMSDDGRANPAAEYGFSRFRPQKETQSHLPSWPRRLPFAGFAERIVVK